jgi:beta-lactam-binding protein with PASTA domain
MIKNLKSLLWIVPFLFFVMGYQLLNQLYRVEKIHTPNLVGLSINQALQVCSQLNLNLRILSEELDADLPEYTILSQKPNHNYIKPNQIIFVVVCKKPAIKIAPNLIGLNQEQINAKLKLAKLKNQSYQLPSTAATGTCFSQSPSQNQFLNSNLIITYLSKKNSQLVIMPKLVGLDLETVQDFLQDSQIKFSLKKINHPNWLNNNLICEQKPEPGSIIDLQNLSQIELLY